MELTNFNFHFFPLVLIARWGRARKNLRRKRTTRRKNAENTFSAMKRNAHKALVTELIKEASFVLSHSSLPGRAAN